MVDMIPGDEDGDAVGKVQSTLAHHLYRDQIRHLQHLGLWPAQFDADLTRPPAAPSPSEQPFEQPLAALAYGNEYGALDIDGDLPPNLNRRGVCESDDDEEEEEGEESGEEAADEEAEEVAPIASSGELASAATLSMGSLGMQDGP